MTAAERPEDLHRLFRAYKRAASRLRDLLVGPRDGLALNFTLTGTRGEPITTSFAIGAAVARHAALLRPFMAAESEIELRAVWKELLETGLVAPDRVEEVAAAFDEADRLTLAVAVNGEQLTARQVYLAYGEGQYFGDDPEAKSRLDRLSVGPMRDMVPMLFHDACANYSDLTLLVLEVLLEVEKLSPPRQPTNDEQQCIYCLEGEWGSGSEEHVIPESLIGDEVVLTGCVCSNCNNALSALDRALVNFEPIAFLRAVFGPLTKKGKFPRADLTDFNIEKTAPREIRVVAKTKAGRIEPRKQPDGSVAFTMQTTGRKPFDPVLLGRALFKIALGMVAYDAGPETATHPRYDAARAFIVNGTAIETNLLIQRKGKPNASVRTWWQSGDSGTLVGLDIFGVVFAFNLEPSPLPLGREQRVAEFANFWLGEPDGSGSTSSERTESPP